MSGKSKASGPAPSMNQLKIQSPVKSTATTAAPAIAPPFQANLIGAAAPTTTTLPQYNSIPLTPAGGLQQQQQPSPPMFGNLVSNQFSAFQ